jgi:hypothetical protein
MVLNDPADPICKPLITIKSLLRAGALPRFQSLWGQAQGGDCHAVAGALMADLTRAGQHGWVWCRASCIKLGFHSWVECDGWAFDASNGCRRGVIVMRSAIYRELRGASPALSLRAFRLGTVISGRPAASGCSHLTSPRRLLPPRIPFQLPLERFARGLRHPRLSTSALVPLPPCPFNPSWKQHLAQSRSMSRRAWCGASVARLHATFLSPA